MESARADSGQPVRRYLAAGSHTCSTSHGNLVGSRDCPRWTLLPTIFGDSARVGRIRYFRAACVNQYRKPCLFIHSSKASLVMVDMFFPVATEAYPMAVLISVGT